MSFNREHPSPRYLALLEIYRDMHVNGAHNLGLPAELTFDGHSLRPFVKRIKRLIDATGARSILDYGSGKGQQYDPAPLDAGGERWDGVLDYWGVDEVTCFDPGYGPYSKLPSGKFDGVVSTDVLEHCPEEDIGWIVDEIFSFATRFVFLTIACYPAQKLLPNGENAHCTVRTRDWWKEVVERAARERPGVVWEAQILTRLRPDTLKLGAERIGS